METNTQVEFFKIVSQIIPVLFLSVSVQSVFTLRREEYKRSEKFQRNVHALGFVTMATVLFLGELVCLRTVYFGSAAPNDLSVVTISLISGSLWVLFEYILYLLGRNKEVYLASFVINILVFCVLLYLILSKSLL